jgi:hypothetical protein
MARFAFFHVLMLSPTNFNRIGNLYIGTDNGGTYQLETYNVNSHSTMSPRFNAMAACLMTILWVDRTVAKHLPEQEACSLFQMADKLFFSVNR